MRVGRDVLVAGTIEAPLLGALDAIHVATAFAIGDSLSAFVIYDRRQLDAIRAAGMTTASPGL